MSSRRRIVALGVLGLLPVLAAAPAAVVAANRYVAPAGADGTNDCTVASAPCKRLAHALAAAASGDTLNLAAGRYRANLRFDATLTLVLLGGWDPTFTTRDPAVNVTEIRARSRRFVTGRSDRRVCMVLAYPGQGISLELDGVTLTRGKAKWSAQVLGDPSVGTVLDGGGALHVHAAGGSATVVVRRSVIAGNTSRVEVGGGVFVGASSGGSADVLFDRVLMADNHADYGGALFVAAADPSHATATLVNSVVTDNHAEGSAMMFVHGLGGPVGAAVANVRYTTVTGNSGEENEEGAIVLNQGIVNISNSIVWGNPLEAGGPGADLTVGVLGVANIDHSDVGDSVILAGSGGVINDLGGNLSVDPLLSGYELTSASDCIDVGDCTAAPSIDFKGVPRPTGPGCDLGEFVP